MLTGARPPSVARVTRPSFGAASAICARYSRSLQRDRARQNTPMASLSSAPLTRSLPSNPSPSRYIDIRCSKGYPTQERKQALVRMVTNFLSCVLESSCYSACIMQVQTPKRLDDATARKLAVNADVDPKTIQKAYRGETIRGMAGYRARQALIEAGLVSAQTGSESANK